MITKVAVGVPPLMWAALGLIAAVLCGWAVEAMAAIHPGSPLLEVAAYVGIWAPLLVALGLSFAGRQRTDIVAALGLQYRVLDMFWGVGIGFLARAADAVLRMLVTGSTGLEQQPTLGAVGSLGAQGIALGFVAPVLIAPVLEEVYFRGLIQPRLASALGRLGSAASRPAAVVLTSVAFALVHTLLLAGTPAEAMITGASTLLFGLLAGATAASTRRLGGPITGHVVFNGLGVLLA